VTCGVDLRLGDCLEVLRQFPDNHFDSVVTDPPYGLAFMGKRWDYDVPSVEIWQECLRVLKPGGHLLAFAGTRTQHRMCVRIEDAGFEIRDMIAWVYGSGFPKSHNVSCSIDKAHGHPNRGRAIPTASTYQASDIEEKHKLTSNPVEAYEAKTDAARQWQGWGTALKPALEPITVARKPLIGTVADNVLRYGTGAINIDGCRVGTEGGTAKGSKPQGDGRGIYGAGIHGACEITQLNAGRWPANLIHDGSDEVVGLFPESRNGHFPKGGKTSSGKDNVYYGSFSGNSQESRMMGDSGSAARFFYCAKASKRDRDEGNIHPTVKPTELMRYLCRLVTQPGGTVLDPFMGSGSTGKAALLEGFNFIGIERDEKYIEIARARIGAVQPEQKSGQLCLV
jgi:DNA modification methylase